MKLRVTSAVNSPLSLRRQTMAVVPGSAWAFESRSYSRQGAATNVSSRPPISPYRG
jgi:hypothetical protein